MYWLIETKEQLNLFIATGYKEVFIEILPYKNNTHPCENGIVAIYIRPLNSHKGFIVNIDHSEAFPLDINDVKHGLNTFDKIYVRDKKEFLHYFIMKNVYDITLFSQYVCAVPQSHIFFYDKYPEYNLINRIIPIVKHYEYCEKVFDDLKNNINNEFNDFYNTRVPLVFNAIERNGLHINRDKFKEYFYDSNSDYVYTQYNYKTTTGRPSNKYQGINYAALNKENGERECFIPRNDKLIEIDLSAYHPTLLAKLVDYNFEGENIYETLSTVYGTNINKAKELTFKQLYGGIYPQYKEFEFFKKVQEYIDKIWGEFNNNGFIECPVSKYKFEKNKLDEMNPQKLLNYLLQNLETSNNVCILWEILKILRNKNTKLVLYVYDSFLFDFDNNEQEILDEILNIFKNYNLKIKIKTGINYNQLETLKN